VVPVFDVPVVVLLDVEVDVDFVVFAGFSAFATFVSPDFSGFTGFVDLDAVVGAFSVF
jgi:hypothetical protein